ncbi:MAG: ZIP family metal transporter [Acidimicrobiia bacterium]
MSTLGWVVISGLAMSSIALVGSITLFLPERTLGRLIMPLVAFAAGSLLGGALFHMLPGSVEVLGNRLAVYVWLTAGFVTFFLLEQYLQWHHCHRTVSRHGPLGYLILLADGAHNFIGGLAVAGAFIVDLRLGLVTWLVAAAHEVPQELGDFGILVHSGWSPHRALLFNLLSALTFLLGGLIAYAMSGAVEVAFLVPFAAGNFIYIAAADLLPQLTASKTCATDAERRQSIRDKVEQSLAFGAGLALLLLSTALR